MSSDVKVSEFDYEGDDDGNLVVTATLENTTDESRSVTIVANVKAGEGNDEQERDLSQTLDVAAGEKEETSFTFDVSHEQFDRNGSLDLEVHPA